MCRNGAIALWLLIVLLAEPAAASGQEPLACLSIVCLAWLSYS
jgi:hypothetical protein